jgi:uncharacterized protein YaaN involved in tellurite resistance
MINELIKVESKSPERPDGLTDEQVESLKSKAVETVNALVNAKGSEALTISDQLTSLGIRDQKNVAQNISLLQERIGKVFYSDNKTSVTENMAKDISELQGVLTKINPKDIQKEGYYRFIRIFPFFGDWLVNVLRTSANRRMTLKEFVDHLQVSLETGETMIRQDNAQLKVMYEDIEKMQKLIATDAYFAEMAIEELSKAVSQVTEEKKRNELNKVLFSVATRGQDLRAMENAHAQFFVSIEMTRDNNEMLAATVQRMLTLGMNVVYVAFAIHAALARQRDVLEMTRGTRNFIGNTMVSNAQMINSHVKEIGDLYSEPIIAKEKLEKSIEQLSEAITSVNRLKSEGIVHAKLNIIKIKELTNEIRNKAGEFPNGEIKSLEASKVLQLKQG